MKVAPGRSRVAGRMVGWLALLLAGVMVVAACGNGGDEAATDTADETAEVTATAEVATAGAEAATAEAEVATAEAATAEADDDAEAATDGASADPDASGEGQVSDTLEDLASDSGAATVTIGDQTYEFTLAGTTTVGSTTYVGRCQSIFGMIAASGFVSDGRDITVDMEIPPVDWASYTDDRFDAPAIQVEDNEANANYVANESDEFVTGSGVSEFEQAGGSASGTAMFVNAWDPESEPVEGSFEVDCAG